MADEPTNAAAAQAVPASGTAEPNPTEAPPPAAAPTVEPASGTGEANRTEAPPLDAAAQAVPASGTAEPNPTEAPPAAAPKVEPASGAGEANRTEAPPLDAAAPGLGPENGTPATPPPDGLDVAELTARAAERDEYLALAQRTRADFENYRKRVARDGAAAETRAVSRLVRELLPAIDNLERALAASAAAAEQPDGQPGHLVDGMRLVRDGLLGALARAGVDSYDPRGERFDPELHEAIAQHEVAGATPGTVVEVYQAGYRLNGTLLRPARVVVAGAPAGAGAQGPPPAGAPTEDRGA